MLDNVTLKNRDCTNPIVAVHVRLRVILPRLRFELCHRPNENKLSRGYRERD